MDLKTIVADFTNQLSSLIENEATARAQATVLAPFGTPPRRGPGRPPKSATAPAAFRDACGHGEEGAHEGAAPALPGPRL